MIIINLIALLIAVTLTIVVFRIDKNANKAIRIICKTIAAILLFAVVSIISIPDIKYETAGLIYIGIVLIYLVLIVIGFFAEYPLWEDWSKDF